ncbi:MAG: Rrf2 family transcriptional regulator [Rugosibacter sp.]|nr:Rrf2 family transcriptional regulator [Rugosibacter sp.]MDD3379618.1 Rrf2 family transcriptional regulator [Rugosibacter sp.]HPB89946.1 Rrf2 family transcriptional regulator [Rugosibacter sp.]
MSSVFIMGSMQLTSFTDYGLRSLMYLAACTDRLSSVKEIADYYGISRNHLVKVVHRLAQLGYIETSKGKGGGIRLAWDARKMRMGDLVTALESSMNIAECFNRDTNTCQITNACQLKHYLYEASRAFTDVLNQYTLADAIKNKTLLPELSRKE